MKNSLILWRGPSALDGSPIRLVISGLTTPSTNPKTGDVLQTWILPDDLSPAEAVRTGQDRGVCGSCPHRHHTGGGCYVLPWQAPTTIWRSTEGTLTLAEELSKGRSGGFLQKLEALTTGRTLRMGSYGDPTAVPAKTWQTLVEILNTSYTLGYTHQWSAMCLPEDDLRWFRSRLQASTESDAGDREAQALGWSTFRIIPADGQTPLNSRECPASTGISCDHCMACGANANIYIRAHGARKARFS